MSKILLEGCDRKLALPELPPRPGSRARGYATKTVIGKRPAVGHNRRGFDGREAVVGHRNGEPAGVGTLVSVPTIDEMTDAYLRRSAHLGRILVIYEIGEPLLPSPVFQSRIRAVFN